jgi:hypothetical protein
MVRLENLFPFKKLYDVDDNLREINIYEVYNSQFFTGNIYYPNVIMNTDNGILNPINETILSLKDVDIVNNSNHLSEIKLVNNTPYFFFIYNTDNYYHFLYDTLPYLISYFELKKQIPDLKLLMNYPHYQKISHYRFVTEFLEILSITDKDVEIVSPSVLYKNIYISNSYTHDNKSNLPPRKEIYRFYDGIIKKVTDKRKSDNLPNKIYISRRTWVNGDTSNIGTNYTTKRKLVNEDDVVEYLTSKGYVEIFTENLSTEEKIVLFNSADHVIGPIGGGLCNSLFSNSNTKLTVLNSPTFLDVNHRFVYSFEKVNYEILNISKHIEDGKLKKYMRVKTGDLVGEIVDINNDQVTINYSTVNLAGWNNDIIYNKITKNINDVIPIDNGLNSEWILNIEQLKKIL